MADFIDDLANDLESAMRAFVSDIAGETRERVGVPVQYVAGPRGGRRVVRSKPNEPPRKDTGALQGSITTNTASVGDGVQGYVHLTVPYAEPLVTRMQRLILDDRADDLSERFNKAMTDAV